MKLTFWGAAKQVTGSMYLLELDNDYRILIDCGFDMDKNRHQEDENNSGNNENVKIPSYSVFPFEPSMVNVVLLTHAHIDHSGNLPNLVREGFEGQIVCTTPTHALSSLLLYDSASLNQKKIKQYETNRRKSKEFNKGQNNKKNEKNTSFSNPKEWYLPAHVEQTERQFFNIEFNRRFQLTKGVWVTFIPTGHLLGAANIVLEVEENGEIKKIGFSGDIGRHHYPLLKDPEKTPEVDYLLCETTYGSRNHTATGNPEDEICDIIHKACVEVPGRLIIPSFSVGRTQSLLFTLNKLAIEGRLPAIKVFADSPLAYKSTATYNHYVSFLNEEAKAFYAKHKSLFDFENLVYVEDMRTSKQITNHSEPCIIISSSGMVQGGRVEHHIKSNISNPYATILMIGYASEGTVGHQLITGKKMLTFKDKEYAVLANVRRTDIYSGHAGQDDLLNFVKYQNPEKIKKIFLIHGEETSMQTFKALLEENNYKNIEIPAKGVTYEL